MSANAAIKWIQPGRWEPKSFPAQPAHFSNGKTVIRIQTKRAFQHVIELDWADYDQEGAEELAKYICDAVNARATPLMAN